MASEKRPHFHSRVVARRCHSEGRAVRVYVNTCKYILLYTKVSRIAGYKENEMNPSPLTELHLDYCNTICSTNHLLKAKEDGWWSSAAVTP